MWSLFLIMLVELETITSIIQNNGVGLFVFVIYICHVYRDIFVIVHLFLAVTMPFVMEHLEKKPWFMRYPALHLPFQTLGVGLL
jgi:hypothetical protein